jgi:hypothetical protein
MTVAEPSRDACASLLVRSCRWGGIKLHLCAAVSHAEKYLEAAAFASGIILMMAGLIHLKRAMETAIGGEKPTYWAGCWRIWLGVSAISVPAIYSKIILGTGHRRKQARHNDL